MVSQWEESQKVQMRFEMQEFGDEELEKKDEEIQPDGLQTEQDNIIPGVLI